MHIRSTLSVVAAASIAAIALPMTGCQSGGSRVSADTELPSSIQMISADAQAVGKPALVVVGAEWCPACRAYEGNTLANTETRREIDRVAYYQKLDYDINKSDVRSMGVYSQPTTMLIIDGAPVARFT